LFLAVPAEYPGRVFPSSRYSLLFFMMAGLAVLILAVKPFLITKAILAATHTPAWAAQYNHIFFYKWQIEDNYPFFYWAYPLAVFLVMAKDFKKGTYLFLLFAIPFLLHSFVFKWKEDRYLLYSFQFFLLSMGVLLAD